MAPPHGPRPAAAPHPGATPGPGAGGAPWLSGGRRAFPDRQVWPPVVPDEPQGASTQPFPAVRSAPLPRSVPPPGPLEVPGTAAEAPADLPGSPAPARRPARTALRVTAAVLALAVAVAVPTWNGYLTYKDARPDDQVHTFAAGRTATFRHVSWQVAVTESDGLPGDRPLEPDRRWLRIRVTRTALDPEGVIRRGTPDIEVRHPDGRSWAAQIAKDDVPLEAAEHRIGTPYHYDVLSLVPRALAREVSVCVRPSAVRTIENESFEDSMKRAARENELNDNVLCFRR
ncbi:hypothetical protein ACFYSC_17420 [Streptosporangium sp. NPDC004379]|uniref:hypothetical protein n=1 Tax=Streptosporangium sp. NPDC004379 TaxID=3366189 RepID=UPI003699E1C3